MPLSLNPDGAYAIGIKVGRRSLDVVLVDFCAQVRQRWELNYTHADPAVLLPKIAARLKDIRRKLGPTRRLAVQGIGIGIAAPLSLGGWQQLLGLPPDVARQWQHLDLAHEVSAMSEWPMTLVKDTPQPPAWQNWWPAAGAT